MGHTGYYSHPRGGRMKGGGIVFLIIFVFLFICFIWGITSVVGKVRDAISSKRTQSQDDVLPPHPSIQTPTSVPEPIIQITPIPPAPPTDAAEVKTPKTNDFGPLLEQLEQIGKLRKEGTLTEEEFQQIKKTLISSFQKKAST